MLRAPNIQINLFFFFDRFIFPHFLLMVGNSGVYSKSGEKDLTGFH